MRAVLLVTALLLGVGGCASTPPVEDDEGPRTDSERASEANTQLGVAYLRDGELQQALRKLQKALRQDPRNADAHTVAGVVYERLDERALADEHYSRAVDLAPNNGTALDDFGRFLCDNDKVDRALSMFERAAANPLYERAALALTNAGNCALNAGRRDAGEDYLLRALEADGEYAPALLDMARLRYEDEHYMNARAFYQRYLAVASQTPESAWLGLRIEHELGNRDAAASYRLLLSDRFADSPQTRRMLEWESDGKP
ncbi:MAG: type IV pilus biogenesis/stability protein PilW [Arhodomonas sp.]|nr:type IV pilus biogenesis/stability protein PilW [Arhodomonas sp.]